MDVSCPNENDDLLERDELLAEFSLAKAIAYRATLDILGFGSCRTARRTFVHILAQLIIKGKKHLEQVVYNLRCIPPNILP